MRAVVVLFAFCVAITVRATSVVPPSFAELVAGSSLVFRGQVTGVRVGVSGDAGQRHPATFVTFSVERVLKGTADASITLEFMGGEIAGHRLLLAGLPRFAPGERGVFFVEDRRGRLCPLFRLRHGRYRLVADAATGVERVARDDGSPLAAVGEVRHALAASQSPRASEPSSGGMELGAFERAVLAQAQAAAGNSTDAR